VVADLVPLLRHPSHQAGVILHLPADEEERGFGPPFFQAVQQALRGAPPGAVVKGQGHILLSRRDLRSAVRRHGLSARQAQRGQGGQYKNRDDFLCHRAFPPYFFGNSMRRLPDFSRGKITKNLEK
jgi:hypothetical protein